MIRSILAAVVVWAGLSVTAIATPADAQTFDCRRASQPHQRAVCSDPSLRATDRLLSDVFGEALTTANDPDRLRSEQQEWSQSLSACGDARCLRDAYSDRIAAMQPIDQPPPQRLAARSEPVVEKPAPASETPAAGSLSEPMAEEVAQTLDVEGNPLDAADVPTEIYAEAPLPSVGGGDAGPARSGTDAATPSKPNPMFSAMLGGLILGLIVCVLLALLATRSLANYSMQRYGWPMILNWWNLLHLVAIFAWITCVSFGAPLVGVVVAGGLWLIMLVMNCIKTNLLAGVAMTVIQPFVIFVLWALYGAAKAKAEGRRI